MSKPTAPIIKNDPIEDKSRFVLWPYILIAPKVDAVIKNTLAIDSPVKTINIDDLYGKKGESLITIG